MEQLNDNEIKKLSRSELEKALLDFQRFTSAASKIDDKDITIMAGSRKEQVSSAFVLLFNEQLNELLVNDKLTLTDIKVMTGICTIARFGNLVNLSQAGLADALKLHRVTVNKSIKKLTDDGLLLKTDLGLFINPTLIVKGKISGIPEELWDEALKMGFKSPVRSISRKQSKKSKNADPDMGE